MYSQQRNYFMPKIKETLAKWPWEKIFKYFQVILYGFIILGFLVPTVEHVITAHTLDKVDAARITAIVLAVISFGNMQSADHYRKAYHEAMTSQIGYIQQMQELLVQNKVLVQIIERIDKRVLAQHGIKIRVVKEKSVN